MCIVAFLLPISVSGWGKGDNELLELTLGLPKKNKIRSRYNWLGSLYACLLLWGCHMLCSLAISIFCLLMWTIISQQVYTEICSFPLSFTFIHVPLLSINIVLYFLGPAVSIFLVEWCSEWNSVFQEQSIKQNRQVCAMCNTKQHCFSYFSWRNTLFLL